MSFISIKKSKFWGEERRERKFSAGSAEVISYGVIIFGFSSSLESNLFLSMEKIFIFLPI